ncbi:MAG: HAD family hydrolase [Bryobacteraceae bacterium]
MKPKHYDAILFDFDGVLADSEPLHCAAWADVLKSLEISLNWESYRRYCIGIPDRQAAAYFCRLRQPPAALDDVWALYPAKSRRFVELISSQPAISATIIDMLNRLNGYQLGVVTATERALVEPALIASGVRDRFAVVIGAEDVPNTKPDPDPYRLAMERLGARRALAVEDSDTGECSARAAGLDVVRVESPEQTPKAVLARVGQTDPI